MTTFAADRALSVPYSRKLRKAESDATMTSTIGRPTGQGAAFLAFLLALLVAFAAPTRAAMDEEGYRELNRTLIEDFVLPEYAALAEAAAAFQSATGAVCGQRDAE